MTKRTAVIALLNVVVAIIITGTAFAGSTGTKSVSDVEPISLLAVSDTSLSLLPGDPVSLAPTCSVREERDLYEVTCTDEDKDISDVEVTFEIRRLPANIDFDAGKASIRIDLTDIREGSRTGNETLWFTWSVVDEAGHITSGSFTS